MKTPEQEAEELIESHYQYANGWIDRGYDVIHAKKMQLEAARKGALITVDKLTEVLENVWRDIYGEDRIIDVPNPLFEEILRYKKVRAAIEAKT